MTRVPAAKFKTATVSEHIDSSYDVVKEVYDNLDIIKSVEEGIDGTLKYLGTSLVPPTTRLDGSPVEDGDYYLDPSTDSFVYFDATDDTWLSVDPAEIVQAKDDALLSERNASDSELNAKESEDNAKLSEIAADDSANRALASELKAKDSELASASSESRASLSESNAAQSESNTLVSEGNAKVSEDNAKASEVAAGLSESNSATSEVNASISASNASDSEAAALVHANNAAAAFDNFDDRYLGAKDTEPVVDNDDNPLQVGSSYWDSVDNTIKYWNGVVWETPELTASQAAMSAADSASNAAISEGNASVSEGNASRSEVNSSVSELNAKDSETNSKNSETNALDAASRASVSEGNASVSETNSKQSELAAEGYVENLGRVVRFTGSGELKVGEGQWNEIRDNGVFTIPLANSVLVDSTVLVSVPDTHFVANPTINASGSDVFSTIKGEDTSLEIVSSLDLKFVSDGISKWEVHSFVPLD